MLFDPETIKKITNVLDAKTDDMVELMKLGDIDPLKDLRFTDLSDVRFGDVDVTGWDFTGTRLTNTDMSEVKNISKAIFSDETELQGTKLPDGVTIDELVRKQQ